MTTTDPKAAEEKRPLREDLADLFRMPRELWLVLFAKLLEYVGVFSLLYVLTLWLSKDLGMDDVGAMTIVAPVLIVLLRSIIEGKSSAQRAAERRSDARAEAA